MEEHELPYGERSDGRLVGVSEVERGEACGCVCPHCRRPFVAHKGDTRVHHFQHKSVPGQPDTCGGYYETALHILAKQVIGEAERLYLPPLEARYDRYKDTLRDGQWAPITDVRSEVQIGPIVADIVAQSEGQDVIVEVHVTHRSTPEKLAFLRQTERPAIEIDLSAAREMAPEQIVAHILGQAPRRWLSAPGLAAAEARLAARIEAHLARQRERQAAEAAARERDRARQVALQAERDASWAARLDVEREARQRQMEEEGAAWERERAAERERRAATLAALPGWAADYYPGRLTPPPDLSRIQFRPEELAGLFAGTPHLQAHLALIDQAPIREAMERYRRLPEWMLIEGAFRGSWARHRPAVR